jgi:Kdo2-lipid IVA lauroyltransferase/acyltransferase
MPHRPVGQGAPLDAAPRPDHEAAVEPGRGRRVRAKIEAEYLGFQFVAWLLSAMPLETASNLMATLWRAVAPRLKRHRRALAHLELAFPEKSPQERELLAREMWGHLGRTFAEFFHIDAIFAEGRVVMESEEKLKMVQNGGPYVVCAMHMGNWELLAGLSERLARPLAGVYQPLTNRKVDAALVRLRARMYPLGLFPRSPATLRKLMKIAKDGGSLGFISDLREGKGVAVPFFGRPAHSNTAPALIARTYGLKLYAVRVIRQPGVRFTVRVEAVEVPVTADRDADVADATAKIHARFEEFLREAPAQWMWAHRRWD